MNLKKKVILESHDSVWMPTHFCTLITRVLLDYIKPSMKILELGTGSGKLSILAGLSGAKVVGLDINEDAVKLTRKNWLLNNLKPENGDFRQSDLFSALHSSENESFDLIFSNPPTFPDLDIANIELSKKNLFELSGKNGRFLLDTMLLQGSNWLKPNGTMIVIATSKQGWLQTEQYLNQHWKKWEICEQEDLLLASHYNPYIEYWREQGHEENDPRIFKQDNQWTQRIYVIKACK